VPSAPRGEKCPKSCCETETGTNLAVSFSLLGWGPPGANKLPWARKDDVVLCKKKTFSVEWVANAR
jgi:hypothetical protein